MIAVIQADKEGKTLEVRSKTNDSKWETVKTAMWNFYDRDYRIKPEIKKRYWSKPEDVPMCVTWVTRRAWAMNIRSQIKHINIDGIVLGSNARLGWHELEDYLFWNGKEWVEPICEDDE